MSRIVATAEIDINAPATQVWAALTDPAQMRRVSSSVLADRWGSSARRVRLFRWPNS
jgi:hypothetical protein